MTLVFDRRQELAGRPGLHALIVGISAYRYLAKQGTGPFSEFVPLTAAALTAIKIYAWLIERRDRLAQPLATCRLLLSPSEGEIMADPTLKDIAKRASMENFLEAAYEWRNDAATRRDNATFFYQASHGIRPTLSEFILLCDDFGHPAGALLRNAYSFQSLYDGMAASPALPDLARTQFYFVDSGGGSLPSLREVEKLNATPVFDAWLKGIDDRRAPIFYAAAPGGTAYAVSGVQTLFSQALLTGLNGAAATLREDANGDPTWCVSTASLNSALERIMADFNRQYNLDMGVQVGGLVSDAVIHYLDAPPRTQIRLSLEPAEALPLAAVELRNGEGEVVWSQAAPLASLPAFIEVEAGLYVLRVTISPPTPAYRSISQVLQVLPPGKDMKVNLAQTVDRKAIVTP